MAIRKARLPLFVLLLSGGALLRMPAAVPPPAGARAAEQAEANDRSLPPAANLRVRVADSRADIDTLLDPAAAAWQDAAPTNVLMNRTPRVYQTEAPFAGKTPHLEVRAVRAGGRLVVRLEWDDATKDAPQAPPRKTGDGGDPDRLYKRPTGATSEFADAAAVMVPEKWAGPGPPLNVMKPHLPYTNRRADTRGRVVWVRVSL